MLGRVRFVGIAQEGFCLTLHPSSKAWDYRMVTLSGCVLAI